MALYLMVAGFIIAIHICGLPIWSNLGTPYCFKLYNKVYKQDFNVYVNGYFEF